MAKPCRNKKRCRIIYLVIKYKAVKSSTKDVKQTRHRVDWPQVHSGFQFARATAATHALSPGLEYRTVTNSFRIVFFPILFTSKYRHFEKKIFSESRKNPVLSGYLPLRMRSNHVEHMATKRKCSGDRQPEKRKRGTTLLEFGFVPTLHMLQGRRKMFSSKGLCQIHPRVRLVPPKSKVLVSRVQNYSEAKHTRDIESYFLIRKN